MSEVLFDVGVLALAHTKPETPGQGSALSHVREAIRGERSTVIPYPAIVGAHHVLRGVYRMPRSEASHRLTGLVGAQQPCWYGSVAESDLTGALALAGQHNIDAWDGYYAHVARETGATTILTLDDDFDRIGDIEAEIVLSEAEFENLTAYINDISG